MKHGQRATYNSWTFRYIAAGSYSDYDTLVTSRQSFLDEVGDIFVQMLGIALEMNLPKLGIGVGTCHNPA
jgi:hypothetical protein